MSESLPEKRTMPASTQNISRAYFFASVLMICVSTQQIPTQLTFLLTSRSVNGSSATGHCTGATRLFDRYQCDDPTSSVVYDGIIPTLTGLDGNMWASQLLTLNAGSAVLVFDFTGSPNFQVRRVEIVVFYCPQWGISLQSVVLTDSALTQLGAVNLTRSSCDSLVRFCIPNLSITSSQAVLRLEFATLKPTDWTHIAEVGFYGNNHTCPQEVILSEPSTTTTSIAIANATATSTSNGSEQEMFSPKDSNVEVAAGVSAGVLFFVVTVAVVAIAVVVICVKRKREREFFQGRLKDIDDKGKTEAGKRCMHDDVDYTSHNESGCVQSPVNQDEEAYDQLGGIGRDKPQAIDETHVEAYSQLDRLHAGKLSSVSEVDNPEQPEMYAVVNKPKRHKPSSQPTQPPDQEYAVVNKHHKRRKPPPQPTQPSPQEYAAVNKHHPPEVPVKSDLVEELKEDEA